VSETTAANNNAGVISGLRKLADYLEAHPELPLIPAPVRIHHYESLREGFVAAIQTLGSFRKEVNEYHFTAVKSFGAVDFCIFTARENLCKRIVTWDCPDEPLLAEFTKAEEKQEEANV
jgi:hypothetical protein